jgi:hypothetical protein
VTKSNKTEAGERSAQILGAALALGMTLGMVTANTAVAADADQHTIKLDDSHAIKGETSPHKLSSTEYLKLHGVSENGSQTIKLHDSHAIKGESSAHKLSSTEYLKLHGVSEKGSQTIKLDGTQSVKGQQTIKLQGTDSHKIGGAVSQKSNGDMP